MEEKIKELEKRVDVLYLLRSERKVKINTWLIPIEAAPFKPSAPPFNGNTGKLADQSLSVTAASIFGPYEKVLKVDPRSAEEGGEVMEEEGKADFFFIL